MNPGRCVGRAGYGQFIRAWWRSIVMRQTIPGFLRAVSSPLVGGAIAILAVTASAAAKADQPVSFGVDVMAVLSKAGCNMGVCHGNRNGKGGFKLSLRGDDP